MNKNLKLILIICAIVLMLFTIGLIPTVIIGLVFWVVMDLLYLKTFIKWLLIGVVCAICGVPLLFFICVIVGGILFCKEKFKEIDDYYDNKENDSENKENKENDSENKENE